MENQNLIRSHIQCFLARNIERDLTENMSESISLHTPIGVFTGADGVRKFHAILDENLLDASWSISDLEQDDESIEYHWCAEGPTSTITRGVCKVEIKNGKIENEWIQCRIEPYVMAQG